MSESGRKGVNKLPWDKAVLFTNQWSMSRKGAIYFAFMPLFYSVRCVGGLVFSTRLCCFFFFLYIADSFSLLFLMLKWKNTMASCTSWKKGKGAFSCNSHTHSACLLSMQALPSPSRAESVVLLGKQAWLLLFLASLCLSAFLCLGFSLTLPLPPCSSFVNLL